MPQTYTPPNGYTPQAQQVSSNAQALAGMPPMQPSAPAQQANSMAQQYPQFVQQQSQQIGQNAQLQPMADASGDLQKQYALFQHDMQMAGGPTGAQSVSQAQPPGTGDPLAYGYQMGQSNPYAGMKFMDSALSNSANAESSMLGNTQQFNLGEFTKQLGAAKDIYQMKYNNLIDQSNQANQAQQLQENKKMDMVSAANTLLNAGILTPEQATAMLGLPAQAPEKNDIATAVQTGDRGQIQQAYIDRIAAAPTDAARTKIAQEYKTVMGEDLFQVTKQQQQQQDQASQLKAAIANLKTTIGQKGAGIPLLDMIPGLGGREGDPTAKAQYEIVNNLMQNYYKTKTKTPITLPPLSAGDQDLNSVLDAIMTEAQPDLSQNTAQNDPLGIL